AKLLTATTKRRGPTVMDTFTAIAEFEARFFDTLIDLDNADYWFDVDVLGCGNPQIGLHCRFFMPNQPLTCKPGSFPDSTLAPPQCELVPISAGQPSPPWRDQRTRTTPLMDSALSLASRHLNPKLSKDLLQDSPLRREIIRSAAKLAGHPRRAKTLSLVQGSFTWPSMITNIMK
ncbi:uncharacterized protein VP01_9259g1, partial [Puccinia sorghi]